MRIKLWSAASRALLAVSAVAAVLGIAAYLAPRELRALPGEQWVAVAPLDSLEIGEARLELNGTEPFHLVRVDDHRIVAASATCTHLSCVLGWDRGTRTFVCPCHGDRWNLSGAVMIGPATRPLRTYTVSVRAGEVWVHL